MRVNPRVKCHALFGPKGPKVRKMVSLPAGINEAALISALAIVIGVVIYGFAGASLPSFTYSTYIYPILGIAAIAIGIHMDHFVGDFAIGFGAALSGATVNAAFTALSGAV